MASSAQHKHAPYFLLIQAHSVLVVDLPFEKRIRSNLVNALDSDQAENASRFCPTIHNVGHNVEAGVSINQIKRYYRRLCEWVGRQQLPASQKQPLPLGTN